MRIAYFLNDFPALSQTFVLNQITGLIDLGAEVELFAFRKNNNVAVQEIVYKYKLHEKVRYIKALPARRHSKLLQFGKLLLSHQGIRCLAPVLKGLNLSKFGRASRSLQLPADVIQVCGATPFDIIHCQFGTIANRVLNLIEVGALSGKLVTSFRGYDATRYVLENPGIYNRLFQKGDYFLPVSDSLRQAIIKLGCPEDRIAIVHSGISISKFPYTRDKYPVQGPIKAITIARLVEKKGIEYSIRAVALAVSEGVNLQYSIVGDGELKENLQQLVVQLGIQDNVMFLGWKTHSEVIELLSASHILLAPSITAENGDQEGIPNVMKEAMAMGLPVIGTFHGGTPELVEHEKSGFLVKEKDSVAMAHCLTNLSTKAEIWNPLCDSAREVIESEFEIKKLNVRLLSIYQDLQNDEK